MSWLSAPLPKTHYCNPGSLSIAMELTLRTMELEGRYGYRLAHEIAHRELFVFTPDQAQELRDWAAEQAAKLEGAFVV